MLIYSSVKTAAATTRTTGKLLDQLSCNLFRKKRQMAAFTVARVGAYDCEGNFF